MTISLTPEMLGYIWGFPITNTVLVTAGVSAFLIFLAGFLRRSVCGVPGRVQNIFEVIIEYLLGLVDSVMQDRSKSEKIFPLVATIFFFVLLSNWVELIPGLGTVGVYAEHHGERVLIPFLRSASADLNMTIALSLISVFFVQAFGIAAIGVGKYAGKFFVSPFRKPYVLGMFIGILELVGEVSKLLSFSFRLFGNIFAGEVLLIVMLSLVPFFAPIPFLFLELFVGVIQAFVFSLLTLVFAKMATIH